MDVPDGFLSERKMVREKTAAVFLGEKSIETPLAFGFRTNIQQVHDKEVAGFSPFHTNRAAQKVNDGEVNITDIIG